jgi:hypothetical protein
MPQRLLGHGCAIATEPNAFFLKIGNVFRGFASATWGGPVGLLKDCWVLLAAKLYFIVQLKPFHLFNTL